MAEEMLARGYKGTATDKNILSPDELKHLMANVVPTANLIEQPKADFLENELNTIRELGDELDRIALQRAEILIEAHERFRKVIGGKQYQLVKPVLPMDLMGIYILLPDNTKE